LLETSVEIARRDGTEFRSIILDLRPDGSLSVSGHDRGPYVEKWWGDADYEFWVDIPAEAVARLAFALLEEKYRDRLDAVDDLRDFLRAKRIPHEFDSWV